MPHHRALHQNDNQRYVGLHLRKRPKLPHAVLLRVFWVRFCHGWWLTIAVSAFGLLYLHCWELLQFKKKELANPEPLQQVLKAQNISKSLRSSNGQTAGDIYKCCSVGRWMAILRQERQQSLSWRWEGRSIGFMKCVFVCVVKGKKTNWVAISRTKSCLSSQAVFFPK